MSTLWTEKYRPKDVNSFYSKPNLKSLLQSTDRPNLLLYGPPGTGKTTFAHLLSKTKLELNASDDRGINIIRDKIKSYSKSLKDNTIILDECENLTEDAQHCLRRIIEDSKNTRFIFITNYLSKVIGPLKSRLVKIKFDCSFDCLNEIGKKEGMGFDERFYQMIFIKCNSDLRRSINVLQAVKPLLINDKSGCEGIGKGMDEEMNNNTFEEIDKDMDNGLNKSLNEKSLHYTSDNNFNKNNNNNNSTYALNDNTLSDSLNQTIMDSLDTKDEDTNIDLTFIDDIIGLIPQRLINKFTNLNEQTYKDFVKHFIGQGYLVLQLIYQSQDVIIDGEFYLLMSEMEEKLINGCCEEIVLSKLCLWVVKRNKC